jgi:CubicO group peptidase (beta-lactamase class C family)
MGFIKTATIIAVTAIAIQIWPVIFSPKIVYQFGGKVEPGFEKVEEVFKSNFINGWDFEGGAFAACHNGKMVVDLWAGYADSSAANVWKENTMTTVFSTTKAVCALCMAMLVDRGLIRYEDLVTKYWPEFGQNGKESITVKMLTSHEAGLVVLDEQITYDLVRDWRKMSAALEKQKPNWELGSGAGYHSITYGWLIDQLLRRVDPKKRSLGQFFREEIAEPHKLDFYIGLPLELEYRVARIKHPTVLRDVFGRLNDPIFWQTVYALYSQKSDSLNNRLKKNPNWVSEDAMHFNNPELHALEIGAANGIGTARALAQLFCLVDSGKLINKSLVDQLLKPVFISEADHVMNLNITWGYGFMHTKNPDGQYQLGHPGFGGQNVKYDPHYKLSMAYIRNGLSLDMGDSRSFQMLQSELYNAIKKH